MKNSAPLYVLALALVVSAYLIGVNYSYRYRHAGTISVTGLAEQDFTSDLVVWQLQYSRKALTIKEAYALLKEDEKTVKAYLIANGIKEAEISIEAVNTDELYDYENSSRIFKGYELSQDIKIESKELAKVDNLSRKITELLDKDINISSYSPSYYYSKLGELKHDLLQKAAEDGKLRATHIAESGGEKLGKMKRANMGIFQFTGRNSNEDYSWGGAFNTSSKEKTASITVRMEFEID